MALCLTDCPTGLTAVGQKKKAIPVAVFGVHVTQMHQDRDKGFELEYAVGTEQSLELCGGRQ